MSPQHGRLRRWWLSVIQRRLNPLTLDLARAGRGPFSLIRHVGRKSGRTFETPVILADAEDGLVAELTYGPGVNWYRIVGVEPYPADRGRRAFGPAPRIVLTILRRHEFRLLRVEPADPPSG